MRQPVIVLVGRPNVGKSTLFNRLSRSKNALVADLPGLTRDRHYALANVGKKRYMIVDTGGFEPTANSGIVFAMAKQTEQALTEADVIIFVVDGRVGATANDLDIANKLRVCNKPVYVAINKVEGMDKTLAISDFYSLGFSQNLYPISASHGTGVHGLINNVLNAPSFHVSDAHESHDTDVNSALVNADAGITFAIVGRPNVGKSTLVNAILGDERVIVFDEAGTTRDSISIAFTQEEQKFTIIDTAGIRRKTKVNDKIEKFSVIKALQAIDNAQVVVLVLDARQDISLQDATIVGYAIDAGKSIVVVINKWDRLSVEIREQIKSDMKRKLHFLDFAQFCYVSALKKTGINTLMQAIKDAYQAAFVKMPTPRLTRIMQEAIRRQPPVYKGQFRPKLRYAHQGGVNPPIIVIHGNSLASISNSYTRYLERSFRKVFNFVGTPIRIEYKSNTNPFND